MDDLILYHWSPTTRRKSITRRGLEPGHWSTDRYWKPPVVCLADDPMLAWDLSGMVNRTIMHPSWDLWMVWARKLTQGFEIIPFDNGTPREYRVHYRIFKRDIEYVATREVDNGNAS